jgi:hypothetical protein
MDSDVIKLFGVMLAIMIPVGVAGGIAALLNALGKRRRIAASTSSEDLTAVLDTLERMDLRLQQLEERVDFIERVLPALREGKPLSELPPRSVERTPR